jgi:hypothetical protein
MRGGEFHEPGYKIGYARHAHCLEFQNGANTYLLFSRSRISCANLVQTTL